MALHLIRKQQINVRWHRIAARSPRAGPPPQVPENLAETVNFMNFTLVPLQLQEAIRVLRRWR